MDERATYRQCKGKICAASHPALPAQNPASWVLAESLTAIVEGRQPVVGICGRDGDWEDDEDDEDEDDEYDEDDDEDDEDEDGPHNSAVLDACAWEDDMLPTKNYSPLVATS